jgi:hypothetical protein
VALQYQGLVGMIESGALAPQMMGQLQFLAGVTAYQKKDYASAVKYLEPAMASGYRDQQGLLQPVLADSYKRTNNAAGALRVAQAEIEAARAAGAKPSETSLRTALQVAYDGKQLAPAADLAVQLVQAHPNKGTWNTAINVVRQLGSYQSQEALDLMRLMGRTSSYSNERDYVEYLEAVDPRRLPGEAQKVIEAGISSGKLRGNDPFVTEARNVVNSRVGADRNSLPALERDARAANASADAFLSYGDAAKAEALYTIALGKSAVDRDRVLTRLGIAQADQGKVAEAQATLAKVQGTRKPIAQLWAAYAAQRGGGGTPVAAAQ